MQIPDSVRRIVAQVFYHSAELMETVGDEIRPKRVRNPKDQKTLQRKLQAEQREPSWWERANGGEFLNAGK